MGEQLGEAFISKEKQLVASLQLPMVISANPLERSNIYNQIHIVEMAKWEAIAEGGFSTIEKAEVVYVYLDGTETDVAKHAERKDRWIRKTLVRKVGKDEKKAKIAHEKEVLRLIGEKTCVFIMKFYWSRQEGLCDMLFMDYCICRSLENMIYNQQAFLSPTNRTNLMCQAAHAVRFLQLHGICHLDVKPANMLIGRNQLLRVADFGESYHSSCRGPDYRPGFTVPYSPPEIFQPQVLYHSKLDVYSFGMMLCEVVFERYPMETRRAAFEKVVSGYRSGGSTVERLIVPEKATIAGCRAGVYLLQELGLKCTNEAFERRPLMEWVLIILRGFLDYIDKVY